MGVPKLYRWYSERYPCLSDVVKGNQIPEFDNLYLDMNGIIHKCTHPNDNDILGLSEEQMFNDICHYIESLFRIIKPRKVFIIAVDGVAPRAKMNKQRARRFKSACEAEERETRPNEKRFDSNCITPGTHFMVRLQQQLKYFVNMKITNDTKWQGIRVFLSGHETPGEGEHKIMDFIRAEKARKDYDSNTRHCLYGVDADLMVLGLVSHEPHFSLLKAEVPFGKDKRPSIGEETTFHLLHLSLFREYLALEFGTLEDKIDWDKERIIDDWVLLGFLVGNDFVPNLPDLHISDGALPLLYKTYIEVLPKLDGYLNDGGDLNLPRFEIFMKALSKFDYDNLDRKAEFPGGETERRSLEEQPGEDEGSHRGTSARRVDAIDLQFSKMSFRQITKAQRGTIVSDYIHAIQWILHYYYNGIQSWSWYYPHHYAPDMSDLKDFGNLTLTFDKGEPFLPFQQLMAVLPPASKDLLPEAYWPLMLEETSPIQEYYPEYFEQDLIPFIDETRLLAAMSTREHQLSQEERDRNTHGPHLLYTTDTSNPFTYKSSLQGKFPDIINCIARCELVRKEAFQIDVSSIRKGLLSGVRLGVYFPGFPTLYHLDFEYETRNADVKVFQQMSRGENTILSLNAADPDPDIQKLAPKLLGQTVFAEWPHLKEVKIVALSDGISRYELVGDSSSVGRSMEVIKLKDTESHKWKRDAQTIGEEYFRRKGVNIRDTKIILYACPLLGRRYACGVGGNITLEKQWTISPIPYAYQATLKDIAIHDPSFKQFKTLDELFPSESPCFMLGNPHYGCQGSVVAVDKDRVQIVFSLAAEPNLDYIKATQDSHVQQYLDGYVLARRLCISSMQVSRLTGSVFVTKGPRPSRSDEGFRGSSVNVGLNLKFNKSEQEVPGFTRRNEAGKWVYSVELMDTLDAYINEFPAVARYLNGKGFNDALYEDEMFVGEEYNLDDVKKWIAAQPCSKASKAKIGALDLDAPIVKLIEEEIDKVKVQPSKKKVKLAVRPHLLYKPMDGQGNLIPDPDASYQLFDRVVNVREGYTVPLGLHGVVTGIQIGATVLDTTYDIVFDEEFPGAITLRCTGPRGYRMPPTSLINISYGQRKFKGQQKYEKTTAVVKPQVKQTGPTTGAHTQSQEYYQNRMASLGQPGAPSGSRASQPTGRGGKMGWNNQEEPNPSKVKIQSGTKVREDAGGSPISYAAATTTSQVKGDASPTRQKAISQQPASGMQALGKIPGGKTEGRGGRQQRGQRDTSVPEKRVTILKRNQELSEAQSGRTRGGDRSQENMSQRPDAQDGGQLRKKADSKRLQETGEARRSEGAVKRDTQREGKQSNDRSQADNKGSPSAQLPRLARGGEGVHGDGGAGGGGRDEVDELSAIWQKLMMVQESPVQGKESPVAGGDGKQEAAEDSDEYVTSAGSRDGAESEEEDDIERMTPNTYRNSQTEQLCHLLNITKPSNPVETESSTAQQPGAESTSSTRPGYTKQVSVQELFDSAKKTGAPPRSPINLPQGGPVMHSKPLGQVAPHPQSMAVVEGQPPHPLTSMLLHLQQQLPLPPPPTQKQPFMVHSPSKPQHQIGQAPPHSPVPGSHHPMQASPEKGYQAPPTSQMVPPTSQMAPPVSQMVPPVSYHQNPPPPQRPFQNAPFGMQQAPPSQHAPPLQQGYRGGSGAVPPRHAFVPPGGQGYYAPPPVPPMNLPSAMETLAGWCMAQNLAPPIYSFREVPQGIVAVCKLGFTGISYEGPPCLNGAIAMERAAGVVLNRLRIVPVHQFVGAPPRMGQPRMGPPVRMPPPGVNQQFRPPAMGVPPGYRHGMPPHMMPPMQPNAPQQGSHPSMGMSPPAGGGIFVPLQVTKQLATSVPKPTGPSENMAHPADAMRHGPIPVQPHNLAPSSSGSSDFAAPGPRQPPVSSMEAYPSPFPAPALTPSDPSPALTKLAELNHTHTQPTPSPAQNAVGGTTTAQPAQNTTGGTTAQPAQNPIGGTTAQPVADAKQSPASKTSAGPKGPKKSRAKLAISFSAGQ